MATKLYVGNLSFRTTSEELREAFASVGTVESASVIEDRETGRKDGFCVGHSRRDDAPEVEGARGRELVERD